MIEILKENECICPCEQHRRYILLANLRRRTEV